MSFGEALDEKWFKELRNIEINSDKYLIDYHNSTLHVDHDKKKLSIRRKHLRPKNEIKKIQSSLNAQNRKAIKFQKKIQESDGILFLKNYYLSRVEETKNKI